MLYRHLVLALLLLSGFAEGAAAKQKLTVADAIQTTRAMSAPPVWTGFDGNARKVLSAESAFVSPSGTKYALMLIRGDVERNGNHVNIMVGSLGSLEAAKPEPIVELFTDSLGGFRGVNYGASELTMPGRNPPVWYNDEELAFFWNDDRGVRQVVTVNVRTKQYSFATKHPTDVVRFAISRRGVILYSAKPPIDSRRNEQLLHNGFTVTNPEAFSLLAGNVDGYGRQDERSNVEMFIAKPGQVPQRVRGPGDGISRYASDYFRPTFSPDGRQVLVEWASGVVGDHWERYTDEFLRKNIKLTHRGNLDASRALIQLHVVNIETGEARPLWNAPTNTVGARNLSVAWAPDSKTLLVGPTFLPPTDPDALGLAGGAVAEVDVARGTYRRLPITTAQLTKGLAGLRWQSTEVIAVRVGDEDLIYRRSGSQWRRSETGAAPSPAAPITIELRQDLNTPPTFYAINQKTGDERIVLDLNPSLRSQFALGKVEYRRWTDQENREWTGLLYYPSAYVPGKQYPLVIQTHGHAPVTEFSLNGKGGALPGVGPGVGVYAAQPLANEGMFVLQMGSQFVAGVSMTPGEPRMQMRAFEAAIDYLDREGLIDRAKVGLLGHSRFAWIVEYALTRSTFPYAAAIAADGTDMGYLTASLQGWPDEYAGVNGGAPYGDGLRRWIENAPAFNADKIRTPLQMQWATASLPGALALWEMFSRLRALGRPVELYATPEIRYGSHTLQNPLQCLSAQQRAVDWWKFWLQGKEDADSAKQEQYENWRELKVRQLRTTDSQR